jgi:hypothetical protein
MMKKVLFALVAILPMLFSGCSTSKNLETSGTQQTVGIVLSGASYLHEDSGLKLVFLATDVVDVYTGPDKSPLTCSYIYNAGTKKGEITMPGDSTKAFDFSLSSTGIVLNLNQIGKSGIVPMKKQ